MNDAYICYKYDETPRTFEDAVSYCKSQKASVASVQSMYEQNFIASVLKEKKAWIGLQLDVVCIYRRIFIDCFHNRILLPMVKKAVNQKADIQEVASLRMAQQLTPAGLEPPNFQPQVKLRSSN